MSETKETLVKYGADMRDGSGSDWDSGEDSDDDSDHESDDNSDWDEASELEEDNQVVQSTISRPISAADVGQRRKASEFASGESKRPKLTSTQHFHTVYKYRETGEGEINPEPITGHLTFKDDKFATFSGSLNLDLVSGKVVIHGRKISDVARIAEHWEDYSEQAYEHARVARWR